MNRQGDIITSNVNQKGEVNMKHTDHQLIAYAIFREFEHQRITSLAETNWELADVYVEHYSTLTVSEFVSKVLQNRLNEKESD